MGNDDNQNFTISDWNAPLYIEGSGGYDTITSVRDANYFVQDDVSQDFVVTIHHGDGTTENVTFEDVFIGQFTRSDGLGADFLNIEKLDITSGESNNTVDAARFRGNSTIFTAGGDDLIKASKSSSLVSGGFGNDTIYTQAAGDTAHGNEGNDRLEDTGGTNFLFGDNPSGPPNNDGNDTVVAGNGVDSIMLGNGTYNEAFAGGGADFVHGGTGTDLIHGQDGNDILFGYDNNDTIEGGNDDDVIIGGSDLDLASGNAGDDLIFGDNAHYVGSGVHNLGWLYTGGAGDEFARPSDDTLHGNDGDDRLRGDTGHDLMTGDAGDDQIDGHFGDDVVYGDGIGGESVTDGHDWITAGDGKDYIVTTGGNDTVEAGNGDNKVFAGSGNDSIVTGGGLDVIYGNEGIDTIVSGAGDDFIDPGPGGGVVDGGGGEDLIAVALNVNFTLTNAALFLDADQVQLTGVERLALTGTAAANRFDVTGWTGGPVAIDGAGGSDTVAASNDVRFHHYRQQPRAHRR